MTDRYELEALRQSHNRTRVLLMIVTIIALVAVAICVSGQW